MEKWKQYGSAQVSYLPTYYLKISLKNSRSECINCIFPIIYVTFTVESNKINKESLCCLDFPRNNDAKFRLSSNAA